MAHSPRTLLVAGKRRRAAFVTEDAEVPESEDLALAYGLVPEGRAGWTSLGPAPLLERPLRLSRALPDRARGLLPDLPLPSPFGRRPPKGFREITAREPRFSRLWGRYSVDVHVALERDEKLFDARVLGRPEAGYRVFIVEDGDRYATRAVCVFAVRGATGYVMELLHDRTVHGMRDAVLLLGLALGEMSHAGAESARACALPHSGVAPMFLVHGFRKSTARRDLQLAVRALDSDLEEIVSEPRHWHVSYLDFDDV